MLRYLIVANQTLAAGQLAEKVRKLAAGGQIHFHVLVPATPPRDHPFTEFEARETAQHRLDLALRRLREFDPEITGEVGDAHPVTAITDLLNRGERFDGIVLSTLPPGLSKWLKLDLPHRIEVVFGLPTIHVIGHREPAGV